jgi:hypothetical protein
MKDGVGVTLPYPPVSGRAAAHRRHLDTWRAFHHRGDAAIRGAILVAFGARREGDKVRDSAAERRSGWHGLKTHTSSRLQERPAAGCLLTLFTCFIVIPSYCRGGGERGTGILSKRRRLRLSARIYTCSL